MMSTGTERSKKSNLSLSTMDKCNESKNRFAGFDLSESESDGEGCVVEARREVVKRKGRRKFRSAGELKGSLFKHKSQNGSAEFAKERRLNGIRAENTRSTNAFARGRKRVIEKRSVKKSVGAVLNDDDFKPLSGSIVKGKVKVAGGVWGKKVDYGSMAAEANRLEMERLAEEKALRDERIAAAKARDLEIEARRDDEYRAANDDGYEFAFDCDEDDWDPDDDSDLDEEYEEYLRNEEAAEYAANMHASDVL